MAILQFDVGVVMGSQSDLIWREYMAMHPGTARLMKYVEDNPCCENPNHTPRRMTQALLEVFGEPDSVMRMINELHSDMSDNTVGKAIGYTKSTSDGTDMGLDWMEQLFDRIGPYRL